MALKQRLTRIATAVLGFDRTRDLRRLFGRHESSFSESELILEYFRGRSAGTMLDVGAHHGTSLEPYLLKGWRIHAFEPDPANRAVLTGRIDPSRIRLHPFAVSDREHDGVPFFASSESTGISSLSAFRPTHQEVAKVKVSTLAKVMAEEGVTGVDFLKIDTEGYDLPVLRGFPWDRLKPEVILCEFEDLKTVPLGYTFRDLGDFLRAQGFDVFLSEWHPITRYGVEHQWRSWRPYPCEMADAKGWGNFVAFREPGAGRRERVDAYLRAAEAAAVRLNVDDSKGGDVRREAHSNAG